MKRKFKESADWPEFDSPLLQQVSLAFLRRRKALRVRAAMTCGREFSETDTGGVERLNLDLPLAFLRLCAWADGCMWLGISIPAGGRNAGWAFQDDFHGTVQDVTGETLVS
jgi:hypothetical protein